MEHYHAQELSVFEPQLGAIGELAFNRDGSLLAANVVIGDKRPELAMRVWDSRTGKELFQYPAIQGLRDGPKFSPDGTRLAVAAAPAAAGPQEVKILDASTGKEVCSLTLTSFTQELAFSPDGARLATVGDDSTVRVWDIEPRPKPDNSRQILNLMGHTGLVRRVAFNREGTRLLSSGIDGTIKVWDATNHKDSFILEGAGRPIAFAFNADNARFAAFTFKDNRQAREFTLWELGGEEVPVLKSRWVLKEPTLDLYRLALSREGSRLASFVRINTSDKPTNAEYKLWDAATGKELNSCKLRETTEEIRQITWASDLKRLAYVATTGPTRNGLSEIRIWDCEASEYILCIKENNVRFSEISFSPDGTRLAAILNESGSQKIKMWDTATGTQLFVNQLSRQSATRRLVFSPDGSRVTACTGFWYGPDEITVWDTTTGQRVTVLKGHSGNVVSLAFSRDGRRIASVAPLGGSWGLPGEVKLWDAATGRELLTLRGPPVSHEHRLTFSPDGNCLYLVGPKAGSDGDIEVKVWGATQPRAEDH